MWFQACLNPYSNGMTIEYLQKPGDDTAEDVLILILME